MSEPRRWSMFAGPPNENGVRLDVDTSEYTVRAHGVDPVPVEVIEDPDGIYYGWISSRGEYPQMIQPHRTLFSMQFPYGPDAEVKAGRGTVVMLSVESRKEES